MSLQPGMNTFSTLGTKEVEPDRLTIRRRILAYSRREEKEDGRGL